MGEERKGPQRVDLVCHLRIIGEGEHCATFTSDEGDGYMLLNLGTSNISPEHWEEWARQLSYAAEACRKTADQGRK